MSDKSAHTIHKTRVRGINSYRLADGDTAANILYKGALAQIEGGYVNHWDGTGKFLGIVVSGDTVASTTGAFEGEITVTAAIPYIPEAYVDESGVTLMHMDVAGAADTIADVGKFVYCADSDPANMTVSDTGLPAIGMITKFYAASDFDVTLFTPMEAASHASNVAAGGYYWASFPFTFTTSTSAIDVVKELVIGHAFKVIKWSWIDGGTALVGSSGSRVANMEIGTTDVGTTPSTCTVVQASTAPGRKIDGTTVTGAQTGAATDTFSIEIASGGTDITAGNGAFHVLFQNLDI